MKKLIIGYVRLKLLNRAFPVYRLTRHRLECSSINEAKMSSVQITMYICIVCIKQ